MGKMSRQKGKLGEREVAQILRESGLDPAARRGVQYCGGPDAPDVVCSLPIHFECKRTETCSPYAFFKQAELDAGPDKLPVVAHRKNAGEWMVFMRMSDFIRVVSISDMTSMKTWNNVVK